MLSDPRLPWAINALLFFYLATSSSEQANSYQASIDKNLYKQNGSLSIAWIKPNGETGNLVSLMAIAGLVGAVYQVLNSAPKPSEADPVVEPAPDAAGSAPETPPPAATQTPTPPTPPVPAKSPAAIAPLKAAQPAPSVQRLSVPASITTKQELLAQLRLDCPALLRLVKSHPIRAIGTQRTGKTTLVKKLALLRMVLVPGHQVIACTPHYETKNPYPEVFKRVGNNAGRRDYPAIAREWDAQGNRIKQSLVSNLTTIWDEWGLYDQIISDEEVLLKGTTSTLREAHKHGEFPIFICHGETAAFLPGSRGLVTVFLASTVRVETIGELIPDAEGLDEMIPTGKFKITWLDGTRDEGQLPEWLTDELLISLIMANSNGTTKPESAEQSEQPESAEQSESESEDPWGKE